MNPEPTTAITGHDVENVAQPPAAAADRGAGAASPFARAATGILVAVIALVYAPVLAKLAGDWVHDPNYSHGILVPGIVLFLLWRKRREFACIPRRPHWLGFAAVLGSMGLLVLGAAGAEVFTQRVSFVLLLFALVVYLLGWGWLRVTWFPLAFLFLAIPLPYVLYYSLTSPMQSFAAKCAVSGLQSIGVPVLAQGNILHLPGQTDLLVAEACSGIRSLYSFLSLGALAAYSMPIPLLGRGLVFLATIPLSVAANAFRVWATSLGVYLIGPQVAEGWIHESFGLIVFVAALLLFLLIRKGAKRLWRSAS